MKQKKQLPMFGIGPIYGGVIITLTVLAVILGRREFSKIGITRPLKIPFMIIGVLLIIFGFYLWIGAVIIAKVDDGIKQNKLVTWGAYDSACEEYRRKMARRCVRRGIHRVQKVC